VSSETGVGVGGERSIQIPTGTARECTCNHHKQHKHPSKQGTGQNTVLNDLGLGIEGVRAPDKENASESDVVSLCTTKTDIIIISYPPSTPQSVGNVVEIRYTETARYTSSLLVPTVRFPWLHSAPITSVASGRVSHHWSKIKSTKRI
jgi:hypothetical protein